MHKKSSVFPAFVLLVSKVVLIFGTVLSLGHVLIFGAGVYLGNAFPAASEVAARALLPPDVSLCAGLCLMAFAVLILPESTVWLKSQGTKASGWDPDLEERQGLITKPTPETPGPALLGGWKGLLQAPQAVVLGLVMAVAFMLTGVRAAVPGAGAREWPSVCPWRAWEGPRGLLGAKGSRMGATFFVCAGSGRVLLWCRVSVAVGKAQKKTGWARKRRKRNALRHRNAKPPTLRRSQPTQTVAAHVPGYTYHRPLCGLTVAWH